MNIPKIWNRKNGGSRGTCADRHESLSPLADLPLSQFPGFETLTQPILDSTPSIAAIYSTNNKGEIPFSNTSALLENETNLLEPLSQLEKSELQNENDRFTITENEAFYQVSFELKPTFRTKRNVGFKILKEKAMMMRAQRRDNK